MRRFLLVGLTGGIATGKSFVSDLLRRRGAVIVDADVLAREVVAPGEPALAAIAAEFGPEVLAPDGTLDRKKLGAIVFGDADKRKRLEAITHPAIRERFARQIAGLMERDFAGLVFFDAPVMIESGNYRTMDRIVVVATDGDTQRARLMARDGIDAAEADRKIASQMPLAEKIKLADYVIDNAGDRAATEAQVDRVVWALNAERALWRRLHARADGVGNAGTAGRIAALFPVDMGNYARNNVPPHVAFRELCTYDEAGLFLGYIARRSGNFLFWHRDAEAPVAAIAAATKAFGLRAVVQTFSELVRAHWAIPEAAAIRRGGIVVDTTAGPRRVIGVFLSADVPPAFRQLGPVSSRVDVVAWPTPRAAVCLYRRPSKGGDVGQVTTAIRSAVDKGSQAAVEATGRAMGVIRAILNAAGVHARRGAVR